VNINLKYKRFSLVYTWLVVGCVLWHAPLLAQDKKKEVKPQSPVAADKGGKLIYAVAPNGDRIPDYSYCGYMASEKPIPDATIIVIVPVKGRRCYFAYPGSH
jgi:hypothetical protein